MKDLRKNIKNDLEKLSKSDLIRVLWYLRCVWAICKVKAFGRKFFPHDPMFYQGK